MSFKHYPVLCLGELYGFLGGVLDFFFFVVVVVVFFCLFFLFYFIYLFFS